MDLDKMESLYWRKIKIPKGLPQLLNIFLRETIRHNPPQADIHIFLYELATELANKRNAEHPDENPEDFDPESAAKDKGQQDERDVKTPLGTIKEESLEHPAAPLLTTTLNLSDSEAIEQQKESDPETSVEKVRDESFTESSEESHLLENEPKVKNRGKIKKRITFSIDEDSEPARDIKSPVKVEEIVEISGESFCPPPITDTAVTDTTTIELEPELVDEDFEFEAELQALQDADFESEELISTANKLIDEVEEEVQVFITNTGNTDNRTSIGTSSDIDNFRPASHSPSMSRDSRASEPSEDTTEITESFDSVVRVTLKNNEDSTPLDKNQEDHQIEGQAYSQTSTENKSVEVEVLVPEVDDGIQLLDLDQKQMVVEESQIQVKDAINQQTAEVEMGSDEKLEKIDTEQVDDSKIEIETQNTPTLPVVELESEESLKTSQIDEIEPISEKPELPSCTSDEQTQMYMNVIIPDDPTTIVKRRSKSANIMDVGRRTGINFEDYDENIIAEALKDCSQENSRSYSAGSKPSIKPRTKIIQQSSQSQVIDKLEEQEDNIMMVDIEKELIQEAEAKGDSSEDKRLLARVKDGSRSPTSLEEISAAIDEEEMNASAIKIQSAFRGFQTRKCLASGAYNNGKLQPSSSPQITELSAEEQLQFEQGGQTTLTSPEIESELQIEITPEKILKFIEKDKSTDQDQEVAKSSTDSEFEGKDLNLVVEEKEKLDQTTVPVVELEGKVRSVEKIEELSIPEPGSECDSMLNESATKIQAHFRGYQTRKELKGLVSPPTPATPALSPLPEPEPEPVTSVTPPIPPIPPRTPEEEALEEFIEKEVMDSAATRIQAQYRGFKVRKDFENKKLSTIQPKEEKSILIEEKVNNQESTTIEDKGEKVAEESKDIIQNQGQTNTSTLTAEEQEEVDALKQMIAEENEEGIQALNKAAVSLQSKFKGFKARKNIKKPAPAPEVKMIEEKKIELQVEPEPEQMLPVEQFLIDNNDENVELPLDEEETSSSDNSQIMNKSATKIQAHFRGYQTRKRIGSGSGNNKKSQSITSNVITDDNNRSNLNNEYYASAVKIQSGVRGFLVRQRVKKNPEILPRNKQFHEKKKAVVKIQATVRGFLTRRRLAKARQRRKSSSASLVSNRSKE